MSITLEQLSSFFEETSKEKLAEFVEPLNKLLDDFEINTPNRIAMFLAQIGHESGGLKIFQENLNYKAEGLTKIFHKYFEDVDPNEYAHNPEKIANRVYANRMGNGDEDSGDGWKFHGRGAIQLTGRSNYISCGKDLGVDLDANPDYLTTPEGALRSAAWFWDQHDLNELADAGDIEKCTRKINGGTIGLEERTELYKEALALFT